MPKLKIVLRVITAVLIILGISAVAFAGYIWYWMCTTEVDMEKYYNNLVVEQNQTVDYKDFINPSGATDTLKQIDPDIRLKIAEYMKENNLKLKEGKHHFNRVNGTYDKYINDEFKFEKIE